MTSTWPLKLMPGGICNMVNEQKIERRSVIWCMSLALIICLPIDCVITFLVTHGVIQAYIGFAASMLITLVIVDEIWNRYRYRSKEKDKPKEGEGDGDESD